MANKYLDQGGVEHLWSKIKSWLSSNYATKSALNSGLSGKANSSHTHTYSQITNLSTWKTNNFGSGTYNNSGKFAIDENVDFGAHALVFGTKDFSVSANNVTLGVAITSYKGIAMSIYAASAGTIVANQTDHKLSVLVIAADSNGNVYAGSETISAGSTSSIKITNSSAKANNNCLIIWYSSS